jgi:hypothetical protein
MSDDFAHTYKNGVNLALSGFQFLEETLKTYLELYFAAVRHLTGDKLYFGFERSDYQEAALGRLVQVFSKTCSDKVLVAELRSMVKKRDHIAHQALLRFFRPEPITGEEWAKLLTETQETVDQLGAVGPRMVEHLRKVEEIRHGA